MDEIALNFDSNPPLSHSYCNEKLRISKQGWAIKENEWSVIHLSSRFQRKGAEYARVEQLAAQLSASQLYTSREMMRLMKRLCEID